MLKRLADILSPYKDVIIFMITLVVSNFFWKYTVLGEETCEGAVTWFGLDLTNIFDTYAAHITSVVYAIDSLFRDTLYQIDAITLRWESGSGTRIIWACTPLKQSFIWICLMLTTPGWKPANMARTLERLGWIALGLLIIYAFNILRISIITLFIENHPDWFEILHTYIFKYIFYGVIFLLWVIYVEKIRNKLTK